MQKRGFLRASFIALVLAYAGIANAAEFSLFLPNGEPVPNYDEEITKIAPRDVLVFNDGKRFHVEGTLGRGNTTKVFAVDGNTALRVPLDSSPFARKWFNQFADGAAKLAETHAPVPVVKASLKNQYDAVEKLQFKFLFADFTAGRAQLSNAQNEQVVNELVEFAKSTAMLTNVVDLHAKNLAYTNRGWLIVDFGLGVTVATQVKDPIFSIYSDLKPDVKAKVRSAIEGERNSLGLLGSTTPRVCNILDAAMHIGAAVH